MSRPPVSAEVGVKVGAKVGAKVGEKVGEKVGGKVGAKTPGHVMRLRSAVSDDGVGRSWRM